MSDVLLEEREADVMMPEQVLEFLRQNPDFLEKHPEAIELLVPPPQKRGEGVLDMQLYLLKRLKDQLSVVRRLNEQVILSSRDNLSSQMQMYEAVLAVIPCASLEELHGVMVCEFTSGFQLDAVALCLESMADLPPNQDIVSLPEGAVDVIMGTGEEVVLLARAENLEGVFLDQSELVQSAALIRIDAVLRNGEALRGMLAFGARDVEHFHPSQGTELLRFLGRVVSLTLEKCL